jgi:hypothetical protein
MQIHESVVGVTRVTASPPTLISSAASGAQAACGPSSTPDRFSEGSTVKYVRTSGSPDALFRVWEPFPGGTGKAGRRFTAESQRRTPVFECADVRCRALVVVVEAGQPRAFVDRWVGDLDEGVSNCEVLSTA